MRLTGPFHKGCRKAKHDWVITRVRGRQRREDSYEQKITKEHCSKCNAVRYTKAMYFSFWDVPGQWFVMAQGDYTLDFDD